MIEKNIKHILAKELSPQETLSLLTSGVAPRPIALVSTISKDGTVNLAPFSFFNAFGSNPPVIVFSPARRGRDDTTKDTYNSIVDTKECVVQVVTHKIVKKMNITSAEFSPEIDEFKEASFTPLKSHIVKPPRVKESPFQMECRLVHMIPVGEGKGSANLAICEVLLFHIEEALFENGKIHPDKLDLVGRNGGDFYTRAHGSALFELPKPV